MQVADEVPNPVPVTLKNTLSPQPAAVEADQRGAQLALNSNKKKIRKGSKSHLPKRKPRRPQRRRARLFIKKPEKAVEVAADDHAGCMTETNYVWKPSRAGSFSCRLLVFYPTQTA